jgi:hypothetical protein
MKRSVSVPNLTAPSHRTNLQAALRISIASSSPDPISISALKAADPDSPSLTLTINAKQSWGASPPRPLTLCTSSTILGLGDPGIHVYMRCRGKEKSMLGDPLSGINMHYAEPKSDDWKTELNFATVPPGDEGLTVTRTVSCRALLKARGKDKGPEPGEEYDLRLSRGRRTALTIWWNWGDLEHDLKERKLVDLVDPRLNSSEQHPPRAPSPPPPILLPFGSWDDDADDEGRSMVWLFVHLDTTPVLVKFVE